MDQSLTMKPHEPSHDSPDPWLAGAAGFFFPPLGHVYAGRAGRGFLFFAVVLVLGGAVFWAAAQSTGMGQALSGLWLVGFIAMVVDAALTARQWKGAAPRWYQRAPFYVATPVLSLVLVVAAMLLIRARVVQLYYMPAGSMTPTLIIGDRFLVDKLAYARSNPERGDIIVFKAPPQASPEEHEFVKRVIGLPGETVAVVPDTLLVDGKPAVMINDDPGENSVTFRHDPQHGFRWLSREQSPRVEHNQLVVSGQPWVVATPTGRAEARGGQLWANGVRIGSAGGPGMMRVTGDLRRFGAAPGVQGSVYSVPGSDDPEADPHSLIVLKGRRLALRPGWVSINGQPLMELYARQTPRYEMRPYRIPAGEYFVLGDNRNDSNDSHAWGPLDRKRIVGAVRRILFSMEDETRALRPERSSRALR